jgi:hypothetical protein
VAIGGRSQQPGHKRVWFLDSGAILRHEQSGNVKRMLWNLEDTSFAIVIDSSDV